MHTSLPEQPIASASQIPFLYLVDRKIVFTKRADRFAHVAKGQDFLTFLSAVATAQHTVLTNMPILSTFKIPTPERLQQCHQRNLPPLDVQNWQRQAVWLDILSQIINELPIKVDLDSSNLPVESLEQQADALLAGEYTQVDAKLAPLLAAALQVYWVIMATTLGKSAFIKTAITTLCPVCGMPPIASVVKTGSKVEGLRYLCCSLCASEWHLVRIKCAYCETTKGISYYELEGSNGAIKAEACDGCQSYLKILYQQKDPAIEPMADDLATLALDVLMQEAHKNRFAPNLYFHPGNPAHC